MYVRMYVHTDILSLHGAVTTFSLPNWRSTEGRVQESSTEKALSEAMATTCECPMWGQLGYGDHFLSWQEARPPHPPQTHAQGDSFHKSLTVHSNSSSYNTQRCTLHCEHTYTDARMHTHAHTCAHTHNPYNSVRTCVCIQMCVMCVEVIRTYTHTLHGVSGATHTRNYIHICTCTQEQGFMGLHWQRKQPIRLVHWLLTTSQLHMPHNSPAQYILASTNDSQ